MRSVRSPHDSRSSAWLPLMAVAHAERGPMLQLSVSLLLVPHAPASVSCSRVLRRHHLQGDPMGRTSSDGTYVQTRDRSQQSEIDAQSDVAGTSTPTTSLATSLGFSLRFLGTYVICRCSSFRLSACATSASSSLRFLAVSGSSARSLCHL